MNEDALNKLLRRGLQNGTLPLKLTDDIVDHWLAEESQELPDSMWLNIQKKLKVRLQDAALRASSALPREPVTPLGRLILTIRTEAGLSRADVAERLGKTNEYLGQIEDEVRAIPDTTPEEFATLMEIFHLTLSQVAQTIRRTTEPLLGSTFALPTAVTTGLQPENESATWKKFGMPNGHTVLKEIAELWLRNLQTELRDRNRTDLLR